MLFFKIEGRSIKRDVFTRFINCDMSQIVTIKPYLR